MVPPTLNMWGNWYMSQWDLYIESNPYALNHPLVQAVDDPYVVFKQPNEKSYARFREFIQILDISLLDVKTLQYKTRAIVASTLYLLLAYHFGQATRHQIYQTFVHSSHFLNPNFPFNDLFTDFLTQSFGFALPELLPTIQYMATFLAIPFNYDLPSVANNQQILDVCIYIYIYIYNLGSL